MISPCRKLCVLKNNYCTGCYRSKQEIGKWSSMSNAEHLAIMSQLEIRKQQHERTDDLGNPRD